MSADTEALLAPFRGTLLRYDRPTEPVGVDDTGSPSSDLVTEDRLVLARAPAVARSLADYVNPE